ncbi:ATP-binding protein [uncultured Propionivibrio sp.]|uniref:sensor histidine kinase n=1 Tax=uncultured Propionivibrio sp. TaxID=426737 RepID=UPI0029C04E1E|nr:ATP-binding protein [uncultured Propionivibrio sp.]
MPNPIPNDRLPADPDTQTLRLSYLLGALTIIAIILSLAVAAFWFEKQRHLERASIATANMAELLEESTGNAIQKIDVALQAGRLFYESRAVAESRIAAQLNAYLGSLGNASATLGTVRIADRAGRIRYGDGINSAEPVLVGDFDFFVRSRQGGENALVVSGPVISPVSQEWVMIFARRLSDPDGAFAGTIYASVPTRQFEAILSPASLGARGAATLRTLDLALIHRYPDTRNAIGSTEVSSELRQIVEAHPLGGGYIATTPIDGVERSNAFRRIAGYPLYVIVGLATRDYLGSWQQNTLIIVGLAALAIAVTALAAYRNYRAQATLAANLAELSRLEKELRQSLEERHALNEQLAVRAHEAEAANRAKSAFLANMSHEMRTPLNHVLGMGALIRREPLSAGQTDRLDKLMHAGRNLNGMIDTVLEVTQLDADTVVLAEDKVRLRELIGAVIDGERDAAAAKHLTLDVGEISPLPDLVGDSARIQRALANYLTNAIRFTHDGNITVRALTQAEDDNSVLIRIEVEDSGTGIAETDIPRLFSLFEQVDNSSTREHGGLGLGLALTRKIARAMGGTADCSSREGVGSLFWFTLRLRKMAA